MFLTPMQEFFRFLLHVSQVRKSQDRIDTTLICIFLVGPLGSGKTTWRKKYLENNECVVISFDDLVEKEAERLGISYHAAYTGMNKVEIQTKIEKIFKKASSQNRNIIIDNPNMSMASRKYFFRMLPKDYIRKAVLFSGKYDSMRRRIEEKSDASGGSISFHVAKELSEKFESPSYREFHIITKLGKERVVSYHSD